MMLTLHVSNPNIKIGEQKLRTNELLSGREQNILECNLQTSQQQVEDRRQKKIGVDNEGRMGWMERQIREEESKLNVLSSWESSGGAKSSRGK